jgi:lysophospholipase L1-like esterase
MNVFLVKGKNWMVVLLLACSTIAYSQKKDSLSSYVYPDFIRLDTALRTTYPFIDYSKNNYHFYSQASPNFEFLYHQLDSMIRFHDRKLNFYHIGGSHVQADVYSNDMRMFLQSNYPDLTGERGMVFPFNLAGTNNPANYRFTSASNYRGYRIVTNKDQTIDFGLMGAALISGDSVVQITFQHRNTYSKPGFCKLRIFHNKGELPYELNFGGDEILIEKVANNPEIGYTDIEFSDKLDSLDVQFSRKIQGYTELEIYGFQFMNEDPGISYTSIGINGAGLYSYLACNRFEEQLKTYPPDFFTFSVGTNDANVPYEKFDPLVYKSNLEKMMKIALRANPKCALLLAVPNDAYYRKKYLNRNIARQREVIIQLAKEYKMAVWDVYGVMGELGSSKTWMRNGLMQPDLVHFTSPGYHLKGSLFIDSFLKYMQQMELRFSEN